MTHGLLGGDAWTSKAHPAPNAALPTLAARAAGPLFKGGRRATWQRSKFVVLLDMCRFNIDNMYV